MKILNKSVFYGAITMLSLAVGCDGKRSVGKEPSAIDTLSKTTTSDRSVEDSVYMINEAIGTFVTDELTSRAALRVHTPGTVDEVSIYLISNPAATLPKDNQKVNFSGKVSPSTQASNLGGQTYYELEIDTMVVQE